MQNLEKVIENKKLIAIIIRKNIITDGVKFLTEETNTFQVGIHSRKKGTKLPPHIHKLEKPLTIKTIQEILYVVSGKVKVSLYGTNGKKLRSKILLSGDSILLVSGGHGVNFMEHSRIFEVKQGPYPGVTKAKAFI